MAFSSEVKRLERIDVDDLSSSERRHAIAFLSVSGLTCRISPIFTRWCHKDECQLIERCLFHSQKLAEIGFVQKLKHLNDFSNPLCRHNFKGSLEEIFDKLCLGEIELLLSRPFLCSGVAVLCNTTKHLLLNQLSKLRDGLTTTHFGFEIFQRGKHIHIVQYIRWLAKGEHLDFESSFKVYYYLPENSDCRVLHAEGNKYLTDFLTLRLDEAFAHV